MKTQQPREGDKKIVKKFAIIPIDFNDYRIWLETVYLQREFTRENALFVISTPEWESWRTTRERYGQFLRYKKLTGKPYFRADEDLNPYQKNQ